ncbi:hypothetical protein ACYSNR_15360 [Enterococcus sp. LJL128]|uniref:hypothetical protein n=1 Tax=Enterococcus sp. LJL51 TaxID=3416656 RepID=UPI003CE9D88D
MELVYQKNKQESLVIYGETTASLVKNKSFANKHILLMTNQKYYDLFSDKLIKLFNNPEDLDWYICKNDVHCNNFTELEALLTFLKPFSASKEYLLIGLGNEGVMELSGFAAQTTLLSTEIWHLPLSIQSLSASLSGNGTVVMGHKEMLSVPALAKQIIYDQTMIRREGDSQLVDFMIFIRCGLVCSHEFLRELYKNFSDQQRLKQQSFTGLLEALLQFNRDKGTELQSFGLLFERAFYTVDGGHLLSGYMKSLLGTLLQLLLSQQKKEFSFHYKNFLIWLTRLGYPLEFPEQIFISDYVQEILNCMDELGEIMILTDIGKAGVRERVEPEELLEALEEYKRIVENIKKGL